MSLETAHDTMVLMTKTAVIAERAGITLAAGSGAGQMLGWTPDQWAIIGVICGICIGFVGMVAKVAMDYHFRSQHLKLAQKRAKALETAPGGLE